VLWQAHWTCLAMEPFPASSKFAALDIAGGCL
jgi:hypothetical protein